MEQEIANQLKDSEAEDVNRASLEIIQKSIKKHRKMMDSITGSPATATIQMAIVNASIKNDLFTSRREEADIRYNEALQSYKGDDALIASKVNRLAALEESAKNTDLTETQEQEVDLLKQELGEVPANKKSGLRNSNLMTIASESIFDKIIVTRLLCCCMYVQLVDGSLLISTSIKRTPG